MPLASHAEGEPRAALISAARQALVRNDAIDAEMKLRRALARGASREQVAAYLGNAYFRQGDRARARKWLAPGVFSRETASEGFRVLAQLEIAENNLAAADRAYDRALDVTPRDADLWVEIGRLRYRAGEHIAAIQAADHAIALNSRNVRALEFRGQLVRDRYGLLAGLPWFEAALAQAPKDLSVLGEYAASLGELGRGSEMLAVTRRMLQVNAGNPRAYYLQAVLAARAGRYELARGLLARTRGKLDGQPSTLLLEAVLELAAGNEQTASELCEQVLERQPQNQRAGPLLARALFEGGQYRYLTIRFRDEIGREDASPYVLTLAARSHEILGERDTAGALLDRAAMPERAGVRVVGQGSAIGALMAQGRSQDAATAAERALGARPGSYDNQSQAGDVQLALGNAAAAQQHYAAASQVRLPENLLLRRFEAYAAANDVRGAAEMVHGYLLQNPGSRAALRLQAGLAARGGDAGRAADILDYLRRTGSGQDVQLLTDLSLVQLAGGASDAAADAASQAYRLQRASPVAAQALALSYATLSIRRAQAMALLDKARHMLGDNPLLAQARGRLNRQG
ncbi:putative Zn-dependent protease [Novosphingobium chloroacetimidivorans]|uniref:Putative Zn-dependent protease n=1 Tax=Novosphingobium chloroacetimidivorans TaxID=1428314 RepID=A0A7W7K6L1_9SPHN|nr:tetratricopeptide repeat protein [Novosphingobium chloroacetimidivorans]MBB4856831.1 putative Zn-dependent protease [Novosphingobium chloroacetimidivorans]